MHDDSLPDPNPIPPASIESDDELRSSEEFRKALEDFERRQGAVDRPKPEVMAGSRVRARIVSIGDRETLVDFGGRGEGVVESRHLRDETGTLTFRAGDSLDLVVVEAGDQVILAPALRAEPRASLVQLRAAHESGTPVSGKVIGLNAGGLEIDLSGVRGFCPLSQIELGYCANPSSYVGRVLNGIVTEIDEARHRAVLSRRALLRREQEERSQALLATLQPGSELEGTVVKLESFGAFVDLGGVEGLVHVSELRHEHTAHPRDAIAEGQRVRVKVLRIEPGKDGRPRIGLSIKAASPDPWIGIESLLTVGQRVRGTVRSLADFGAFVNLAPGIDGLVHVSEAAMRPVKHVKDVLEPGQQVEAIVLSIDPVKKRVSLSIRDALAIGAATERGLNVDDAGTSGASAIDAHGSGTAPSPPVGTALRVPEIGEILEGFVSGIKTYGVFVELPSLGHRAHGLVPREETGLSPGTDLKRRFGVGDRITVMVLAIKEGKIRLSLSGARDRDEEASFRAYQERHTPGETPLTTMGLALRKAMERAQNAEKKDR